MSILHTLTFNQLKVSECLSIKIKFKIEYLLVIVVPLHLLLSHPLLELLLHLELLLFDGSCLVDQTLSLSLCSCLVLVLAAAHVVEHLLRVMLTLISLIVHMI